MVPRPPFKKHVNLNVGGFLKHVHEVSWSVWLLSLSNAIDEQGAGFKGISQDKRWIAYKGEGDESKMDAIFYVILLVQTKVEQK